MAAPVIPVVEAMYSVRYDGTNGADVVAAIPGATLTADSGSSLSFTAGGDPHILAAGYWFLWRIVYGSLQAQGLLDNATYEQMYAPLSS